MRCSESLMRLARLTALACERLVGVAMLRVGCLRSCAGVPPAFATPNLKEACSTTHIQKPAICQRMPRAPTHAEAFNNTLLYRLMACTCRDAPQASPSNRTTRSEAEARLQAVQENWLWLAAICACNDSTLVLVGVRAGRSPVDTMPKNNAHWELKNCRPIAKYGTN